MIWMVAPMRTISVRLPGWLLCMVMVLTCTTANMPVADAGQLTVTEHGWRGNSINSSGWIYATLSLTDNAGHPVSGRRLDDFTITESTVLLPDEQLIDGPAVVDVSHSGDGHFHEETVGDSQIDIVVLVDDSGSMGPKVPHIRSQLHALIDRLIAGHHDFRFALSTFDNTPGVRQELPMLGVGEQERIRRGIDDWATTGEWHLPSQAYYALLWTDYLYWRPGTRQICIIITDVIPQTPYGTFWYEPGGNSADTLSGVEEYLRRHPGLEVYLAYHSDYEHGGLGSYIDSDINPAAGNTVSGWSALEARGLITALRPAPGRKPWPFDQSLIPIDPVPATQSCYGFVWDRSVNWDWNAGREEGRYRVIIETEDPDAPGQALSVELLYRVEQSSRRPPVVVQATDEEGTPRVDEYWGYLFKYIGTHRINTHWQVWSRAGGVMTFNDVEPGRYLMAIVDSGLRGASYPNLNASYYQVIDQTPEGLNLEVRVPTGNHDGVMSRALGLVRELRNWDVPGDPFYQVCSEAEQWLLEMEADGLTWVEMENVKRFYLVLSGYANLSEYARMEIDQSQRIFAQMVEDIAEMMEEVEGLQSKTDEEWRQAVNKLLDILYGIADAVLSKGQFTIKKQAVEQGLEALLEYASRELVPEIKDAVIDELPLGEWNGLAKAIIQHLIDQDFENWDDVIETAQQLAIRQVVNEVGDQLTDTFAREICQGIGASDAQQEMLVPLAERLIDAFCNADTDSGDEGFAGLADALESFAQDVVRQLGSNVIETQRTQVKESIDELFRAAKAQVPNGLPGTVVQFLLEMIQDLAGEAVMSVNVQTGQCELNSDRITEILMHNAFYFVALKNFYVDEARLGLEMTLARAKAWQPPSTKRIDLMSGLDSGTQGARGVVRDLQDDAWRAMAVQDKVANWIAALKLLGRILEPLGDGLKFFAKFYPNLDDVAEGVKTFGATVNGLQITTQAVELGLRLDCLDDFGGRTQKIYPAVYPNPDATLGPVTVTAARAAATEGWQGDAIAFTVRLANALPIPLVVNYTMGGTAENGIDYHPLPGCVFVPRGSTAASVIVRPVSARLAEGNESVTLTLLEGSYTLGTLSTARGTIRDEDLPGVSVQAQQPIGMEPVSDGAIMQGGLSLVFTFARTGGTQRAVEVNFSLWGSAKPGVDYTAVGNTFTIPAGQSSADLKIVPRMDDDDWEGSETVVLAIEPGDYALASPSKASGVFCDGQSSLVWIEATDSIAVENEPSNTASFTIFRRVATKDALLVHYWPQGQASNGYDYERLVNYRVEIPAGQRSVTLLIKSRPDEREEGQESVQLSLQPLTRVPENAQDDYVIGEPSTATVHIWDTAPSQVRVPRKLERQ